MYTQAFPSSFTHSRLAFGFLLFVQLFSFDLMAQVTEFKVYTQGPEGPLSDVTVELATIDGLSHSSGISDYRGHTTLPFRSAIANQTFLLSIRHLGYHPTLDTIQLDHFSENPIKVELKPQQFNISEQVITAEYAPSSPEKSINKVTVIGRTQIENMNAITLRDALTNSLNIRIGQDNVLGSSMSLQGISGENIKILIDGVPVIGRLDGSIDLSQINLNNVERIEIIEGPLSVNYGTNALAGTINIITQKGIIAGSSIGATTYFENIGTHNLLVEGQARLLKTNWRISGGRNYFDGWNPTDNYWPSYQKTLADSGRFKQWKPKEQYFGRLSAGRTIKGWNTNYRFEGLDESLLNRGFPRKPFGQNAMDDTYHTQRTDHAVSLSKTIGKHHFDVLGAVNQFTRTKNTYFKDLTTLNQVLTENADDQDTSSFHLTMSRGTWSVKNPKKWLSYQLGYDLNLETASGRRIESIEQQQGDYALFMSSELRPIKSLTLKPGLRITHNTIYEAPITPSFNALWKKNQWSLRASYARGFRAPSLKELHFQFVDLNHDIVGNPDLLAELSHNFSSTIQHKKLFEKSIIKLELGGYYNQLNNLISLVQINEQQQYSYVNIGEAITQGSKVSIQWISNRVNMTLSANYLGISNNLDLAEFGKFNYTSEIAANLQYQWKEQNIRMALFYKYQGKTQRVFLNEDQTVSQGFINPYHIADFSLSKVFAKERITISTGLKNLLNVQNIGTSTATGIHSSSNTAMPIGTGRTFFVKISLKTLP